MCLNVRFLRASVAEIHYDIVTPRVRITTTICLLLSLGVVMCKVVSRRYNNHWTAHLHLVEEEPQYSLVQDNDRYGHNLIKASPCPPLVVRNLNAESIHRDPFSLAG